MNKPFTLLQFTDLHLPGIPGEPVYDYDTAASLERTLDHALNRELFQPDLLILTGDLVQEPTEAAYRELARLLNRPRPPILMLPGNHDDPVLMERILGREDIQARQIQAGATWDVIPLNSSVDPGAPYGHAHEAELDRLDKALSDGAGRHALIAIHHQIIPVDSSWIDAIGLRNPEDLFRVLDRHPRVKGVIHGHVHQERETTRNGVRHFAAPSTCMQFKPQATEFIIDDLPPGFRELHLLDDGRILTRIEYLDEEGE